jgi:hypothetical protein
MPPAENAEAQILNPKTPVPKKMNPAAAGFIGLHAAAAQAGFFGAAFFATGAAFFTAGFAAVAFFAPAPAFVAALCGRMLP